MSARSLDGGLRGQRKERKVLHSFPPREGAAPLQIFHYVAIPNRRRWALSRGRGPSGCSSVLDLAAPRKQRLLRILTTIAAARLRPSHRVHFAQGNKRWLVSSLLLVAETPWFGHEHDGARWPSQRDRAVRANDTRCGSCVCMRSCSRIWLTRRTSSPIDTVDTERHPRWACISSHALPSAKISSQALRKQEEIVH